jgi:hypothetical protein
MFRKWQRCVVSLILAIFVEEVVLVILGEYVLSKDLLDVGAPFGDGWSKFSPWKDNEILPLDKVAE